MNGFFRSFLGLLAVTGLAAGDACADTFEFLTYTPPSGWVSQALQEGIAYRRTNGIGLITIAASEPATGSPADEFARMWRTHVEPAVSGPAPQPQIRREGEYEVAVGARQTEAQGTATAIALVAIVGQGRAIGVVALADSEALREATAFLDSIAIASNASAATAPNAGSVAAAADTPLETGRIVGGQPSGLFYAVQVPGIGSSRVDTATWLFLPGNRVSRVYPFGGTGLFDASRCNDDTCGSYQLGAGQLAVRWDGGRVDQWTFAATGEGIRLDGALYRPARAMTAASLVGRWSDAGYSGSNIYTFDGNGRFSFGTSSDALTGSYRLQGFALTLHFADGDVRQRTLFAASAGEPVTMISVEGDIYARD
jgi:hypothetical protein